MGLDEHAVYLFQINRADLVAHGLDQRGDAEVFGAAQKSVAGAHDEGERVGGEGVVAKGGAVEFGQYVKPGAKRVLTTGPWGDKIAFVNPDGSTVIVMGNSAKQPQSVTLTVAGRANGDTLKVTLPARSINTFAVAR